MGLATVGVLLNFAIDLEASAAAFYETATPITQIQELKSLFEAMIMQGQSRIQMRMQLYRQLSLVKKQATVTGIMGEHYRPKTECPSGCLDDKLIQLAITMEQQVQDFYRDTSNELGFLDEVPDIFDHLVEDHSQNQKKLQTIG